MTDPELQGIAMQALNMAKRDFEQQRNFRGLLAYYDPGMGLRRLAEVEEMIAERLGENWLDSGPRKDVAFHVIRQMTDIMRPEAMVWVAATNMFLPTEKLKQLGWEVAAELSKGGHSRHHQAVKEGLLSIHDALLAMAQTASRVCMYQQPYCGSEFVGRPEMHFLDQADFGGRLKFYGEAESRGDHGDERQREERIS